MNLQSESIGALAEALAKARAQIENATKDSKNPHFKSTFASLASVINATSSELAKQNLVVVQSPTTIDKEIYLVTTLIHSSGEWVKSYCPLILNKNDMQGLGSALTYARRYALAAIAGITQEDDDGNSASLPQPRNISASGSGDSAQASLPPQKIESPGDYRMPFGKTKGKTLAEVGALEISNAIGWVKQKAKPEFRDSQMAKEFVFWAEQFLRKNPPDELDQALNHEPPWPE
mgnify:CR=1 FL=1